MISTIHTILKPTNYHNWGAEIWDTKRLALEGEKTKNEKELESRDKRIVPQGNTRNGGKREKVGKENRERTKVGEKLAETRA